VAVQDEDTSHQPKLGNKNVVALNQPVRGRKRVLPSWSTIHLRRGVIERYNPEGLGYVADSVPVVRFVGDSSAPWFYWCGAGVRCSKAQEQETASVKDYIVALKSLYSARIRNVKKKLHEDVKAGPSKKIKTLKN
jgi:hypothetical protein